MSNTVVLVIEDGEDTIALLSQLNDIARGLPKRPTFGITVRYEQWDAAGNLIGRPYRDDIKVYISGLHIESGCHSWNISGYLSAQSRQRLPWLDQALTEAGQAATYFKGRYSTAHRDGQLTFG